MKGFLYTDGGARGNPGPSGFAAVLFDENKLIDFNGKFLSLATNNIAEYNGLVLGLKLAIKNNIKELTCLLDSELIVKQVNGEYKIKNTDLQKLKIKVDELIKDFTNITFKHIPREENKLADKIVNLILDTKLN